MNPGGDAAEQVVRLSLEGMEVAARISGNGAKNLALLLYAVLKEEKKTKGKARLTNMLKSGKELKVYTITQKDLKKFSQEAKRYGVLYCVLKDRNNKDPNAAVDVIARAEDASKIQRITERFRLSTTTRADVSVEVEKDKMFPEDKSLKKKLKEGKGDEQTAQPDPEREQREPELSEEEGRRVMGDPKQGEHQATPGWEKTARDPLSEPNSAGPGRSNGFPGKTERPSVREKLTVYKAEAAREKLERAKELAGRGVSKVMDAAHEVAKAVPKIPGKER